MVRQKCLSFSRIPGNFEPMFVLLGIDRRYHCFDRGGQGLVFPEPDDTPARRGQRHIGHPVPLHVAPQLRGPVPPVRGGLSSMLRTDVPEATVNEDGDLTPGKDDVRPHAKTAVQIQTVIFPEAITKPMQCATQSYLGLGVRTPVRTHVPRTALVERGRVVPHGVSFRPGFASIFCRHLYQPDLLG